MQIINPSKNSVKPQKTSINGFSLVELVVALTLMGVLLAAAFSGLGQALFLSEQGRRQNEANNYLRTEVERLRAMPFSQLANLSDGATFRTPAPRAGFQGTLNFQDPRSDLREVHLSVTWTDTRGNTHEARLWTVIHRGGISG
jgi:prepilin-type N-terminal cleavage/methylation domain-containing protein